MAIKKQHTGTSASSSLAADAMYCLHLADNALILAQRNSEWCGHGPVLEQDIAITNISLDLLGQARNLYQHVAVQYNAFSEDEKRNMDTLIPALWKTFERPINEDDLAFLREEHQYLNLLLCELPKGDWAYTILRQFFFSNYQYHLYQQLKSSADLQLAAIAEKSWKEVSYHLRWSSEWVIRLGDGTEESHNRMLKALHDLWRYTGELFIPAAYEQDAASGGKGVDAALFKEDWYNRVDQVFSAAKLPVMPSEEVLGLSGKQGRHTEHMGYLLAEMQYLQRVYPNRVW